MSDEAKNASRSRTVGTSSDYCDLDGTDQLFLANECKQSDEFYENVIEHICVIIMSFGANLRITHSWLRLMSCHTFTKINAILKLFVRLTKVLFMWVVDGGWWLVAGGWWLVVGGW